MKKYGLAALVLFLIATLFVLSEYRNARNEIASVREFWLTAVDKARGQNLTTEEFYNAHSDKGDVVVDGVMPGRTIVQTVELNGYICSRYSISIYYSSDGTGGANLSFVSGQGHGLLCSL